jgi:hypothetical protein
MITMTRGHDFKWGTVWEDQWRGREKEKATEG